MKKLLLLLFLPLITYGQIFIFEDTDLEWNLSEMTVKGQVGDVSIDGALTGLMIRNYKFNIIESPSGTFALRYFTNPSKYLEKSVVGNVYVTTNPLKDLIKAIKKDNFSKINIVYSGNKSFVINKELLIKKQLAEEKKQIAKEQLNKNIQKYSGVYKVKIISSSKIRFNNEFGKLYITEAGITLTTEIPSMQRISGSYSIPPTNKIDERTFSGNLSAGTYLYDVFTLTIDESGTAAGLTLATDNYSIYDTTAMVLQEKITD
jgi:hypothetical protein